MHVNVDTVYPTLLTAVDTRYLDTGKNLQLYLTILPKTTVGNNSANSTMTISITIRSRTVLLLLGILQCEKM